MADTSGASPSGAPPERIVRGTGVVPGIAVGAVYRYDPGQPEVDRTRLDADEVEAEVDVFEDAVAQATEEIEQVSTIAHRTLGEEQAAIVEAQRMMLHDAALLGPVREKIRDEHLTAGHALQSVLREYKQRLEERGNAYLRGRTDDLGEVEARLLRSLERGRTAARIEPNSIVVADRLTATDLIRFHEHGMLGCVTTGGSATSHVSILARALHVPAMVGAKGATDAVGTHDRAVLDGETGTLIVHPSADTLESYRQRRTRQRSLRAEQVRTAAAPAETEDGQVVTVRANVEFEEEFQILDEYGAEGIGLLRSEGLLLSRPSRSLAEDDQLSIYRKAVRATDPHPATVRLLDLGGDKVFPTFPEEPNPQLGWQGVRLLLDRLDELLRPQVRALLRANTEGPLRMLLPMVTHLDEIRRVRSVVQEEAQRLSAQNIDHDPDLPVGTMIEVPATALQAGAFAAASDFLALGTNDLTQYVLAVDRGNDRVASRYDSLHPAVLQLIRRTVAAGHDAGIPVSVCGEIAGDVHAAPLLLGLGLTSLSATPSALPGLKRFLRRVDRRQAQTLADAACDATDPGTVRRLAREWLAEHVGEDDLDPPGISPE
ncbi:MAG: phosphoenolpyruvate--protein phosphotransferase [Salinibacter sp.]